MENVIFVRLSDENFNLNSMDEFIRYEHITQAWRKVGDAFVLTDTDYTLDWDLEKRRRIAKIILSGIRKDCYAYGAFSDGKVVGYIFVCMRTFGSANQYIDLGLFHVSEPYRRMGIGKELFKLACIEARKCGAKKLYISSNPSKDAQAAYRSMGCVHASEINQEHVENEPSDIQMEYHL